MRDHSFRLCNFTIDEADRYCQTLYHDGCNVPARPHDTSEYQQFADGLGYSNGWDMCREHEFLHTWLYEKAGFDRSPTLWFVAHPNDPNNISVNDQHSEEAVILMFQKYVNLGVTDKALSDFVERYALDLDTITKEFKELR